MQFVLQRTRHTLETISKVKNARSNPAKIAPRMLVAAKVIPRRMIDIRIVPKIPKSNVFTEEQKHPSPLEEYVPPEVAMSIARYTTAIPRSTHKNAGVMVIVAIKVSIPAITPMMIAATIAMLVHCALQRQESSDMLSPPISVYSKRSTRLTNTLIYGRLSIVRKSTATSG